MSIIKLSLVLLILVLSECGNIKRLGNNYLSAYTQNLNAVTYY